jgi:hypothetical protein
MELGQVVHQISPWKLANEDRSMHAPPTVHTPMMAHSILEPFVPHLPPFAFRVVSCCKKLHYIQIAWVHCILSW